jgi:hypothetical protein
MKLHSSHLNCRPCALVRRPMRAVAPPAFKRTTGYGFGGKHSATGNLAKPPPPVRHGFTLSANSRPRPSPARVQVRILGRGLEHLIRAFIPSVLHSDKKPWLSGVWWSAEPERSPRCRGIQLWSIPHTKIPKYFGLFAPSLHLPLIVCICSTTQSNTLRVRVLRLTYDSIHNRRADTRRRGYRW